jgi:hypothetical protein
MRRKIVISMLCALSGAALAVAWIAAASSAVPAAVTPAALDIAPIDDPRAGGYGMELVEQYFGYYYGGVVNGDKAYISVGQRFYVFSLANPANPVLLGKSNLLHNPSPVLDVEGAYAYLADPGIAPDTTSPGAGLHVMSISNPYLPDEVYFHPAEKYGYIDIDVYNGYAYIADGGGYLRILSLTNPIAPTLVKSLSVITGDLSRIQVVQHPTDGKTYAYLLTIGRKFIVVDVSDPAQAAIAGILELPVYSLGDLAVQGVRALVADFEKGNLHMLDLSNPAVPALVASSNFPNGKSIYGIEWTGDYVLARQYGTNCGVVILDTTPLGLPLEVGFFPYTNSAGSFSLAAGLVNGLHLGLVTDATGLHVVNASNPAAPELIGVYRDEGTINQVQTVGDLVFHSGEQGLRIYQRTAPGKLVPLGAVDQPGELGLVQDGKAYLAVRAAYDWNGMVNPNRLAVVDISNPSSPQPLDSLDLTNFPNDVYVYGGKAYLASGDSLQIVDVSNPNSLSMTAVYTGGVSTTYAFHSVAVAPNPDNPTQLLAYMSDYSYDFSKGLVILDVTQPQSITTFKTTTLPFLGAGKLEFIQLPGETGSYLALTGDSYISLLEITHPISTSLLVYEDINCEPSDLIIRPGRIYVACGLRGGRLYLASPTSLENIGEYRYPYEVRALDVSSDSEFLYLAAGAEGLFEVWQALMSYEYLPITGGLLTSEYYTLTLNFAADTFTEPANINLWPRFYGNMPGTFETIGSRYYFELDMDPEPLKPYQVKWQYNPLDFPGIDETTLGLYYWDGVKWVREPSSVVNTTANTVSAAPQHASLWALLAERQGVQQLYLPWINR